MVVTMFISLKTTDITTTTLQNDTKYKKGAFQHGRISY